MTNRRTSRWAAAMVALTLVGAVGCGSDDDASANKDEPTTTAAATTTVADGGDGGGDVMTTEPASDAKVLHILVSNDDGIGAKGIDALVEGLKTLQDVAITVIAPKDNQSGTGSKTTPGGVTTAPATTLSGVEGTAVAGFPADSVIFALDGGGMGVKPDLVITGINEGANVGPLVDISGTIGAARAAAQRGIPALASSQGLATEPDYPSGVEYVLEWVKSHRDDLLAHSLPATVTSLNIPTCATGSIRGSVEVPTAADAGGRELITSNCASTSGQPTDDVDGFSNGYATFSVVPNTPKAG